MAIFIVRLGATPVAGHQLAANLVSVLFMLPLALANATGTLVAQRIGARDLRAARRIGWHGLQIGVCLAARASARWSTRCASSVVRLYTDDAAVIAAALPLLAWVALFHTADAAQCVASFVLRAYRIATLPMLHLRRVAVGRGPGRRLRAGLRRHRATRRQRCSARAASGRPRTAGLVLAALALSGLLALVLRRQSRREASWPALRAAEASRPPRPAPPRPRCPARRPARRCRQCGVRPSVPSARPSATHTAISGVER